MCPRELVELAFAFADFVKTPNSEVLLILMPQFTVTEPPLFREPVTPDFTSCPTRVAFPIISSPLAFAISNP